MLNLPNSTRYVCVDYDTVAALIHKHGLLNPLTELRNDCYYFKVVFNQPTPGQARCHRTDVSYENY